MFCFIVARDRDSRQAARILSGKHSRSLSILIQSFGRCGGRSEYVRSRAAGAGATLRFLAAAG
jgi:hypothetical protein